MLSVGCLLGLAAWRVPAVTRQLISRLARRRRVAIPIGIITAGAAAAVISIPVIINTVTGTAPASLPIPYLTPVIIILSRMLAMAIWREQH